MSEFDLLKYLEDYPTKDPASDRYLRAHLYGANGMGKTSLACGSGRPTLHCSTGDNGASVLPSGKGIKTVELGGVVHLKTIAKAIAIGAGEYKDYQEGVLVIDTASGLTNAFLGNLIDYSKVRDDRTQISQRDRNVANPDLDPDEMMEFVGRSDYGVLKDKMIRAIRLIHSLPCDVVWCSWERQPESLDGKKGKATPDLPDATRAVVNAPCDIVARLYKVNGKRRVDATGNYNAEGKSRIPIFESKEFDVQGRIEAFWKEIDNWKKDN